MSLLHTQVPRKQREGDGTVPYVCFPFSTKITILTLFLAVTEPTAFQSGVWFKIEKADVIPSLSMYEVIRSP